jgi:acetyl-CoA synthetase
MFTWDDEERNAENFTTFLSEDFDVSLCVLDYPREDRCDQLTWGGAERGFVRAVKQTSTKGAVLSTFADTISEPVAARLMKNGVAMLAGIDAGVAGIQAAVDIGAVWSQPPCPALLASPCLQPDCTVMVLDEAQSKEHIARFGIPVPASRVVHSAGEAVEAAAALGYPVVAKALGVAHKTDVWGVHLNLNSAEEVSGAVVEMSDLCEAWFVEKMIEGVVAELIVGVSHDDQFGPYLLIGGGGIMVEMMKDTAPILIPTTRERVLDALGQLKCYSLFIGFRGAPPADLDAAADAILAVARMVETNPSSIVELDINPLMLRAEGQGVVAADALISLNMKSAIHPDYVT